METQTIKRTTAKARARRRQCCDDTCASGSRNNYFLGKKLTSDSFRAEQNYLVERRRLLNRAIHGWGVVYGFPLKVASDEGHCSDVETGSLQVGEGLGLDRLGRELVQAKPLTLTLDDIILLDDDGKLIPIEDRDPNKRLSKLKPGSREDCWLLSAHYAEQGIDPVTLRDSCSCERSEWDRTCETIVYSMRRIACDKCCIRHKCELQCDCAADTPCCAERHPSFDELSSKREALALDYEKQIGAQSDQATIDKLRLEHESQLRDLVQQVSSHSEHARGGCRCLCDHLTGLKIEAECHRLCDVDDCTRADLHNGIGLACLKLDKDDCDKWRIGTIYDACGPRRLVKRNDLLFDLINGCDLTRISEIGWWPWHRREQAVPFDRFAEALGYDGKEPGDEVVTRDFWVKFSRPVLRNSLRPDCFAVSVISTETEGGWWQVYRVPVVRIDTSAEVKDLPGYVRRAGIVVNGGWLADAVHGRYSIFLSGETRVEIEVRGDFIEDCNGQAVDANARGRSPFPSGNGEPGNSFLSTFTVEQEVRPSTANRTKTTTRLAEGVSS